jgi:SAM-dependent methyltransferase
MQFIIGEYWFDIKFHVNTHPSMLSSDDCIIGPHLPNAAPHFGSNWFILKKLFSELIRQELINPASTHMVDFGCGAGRALMAALYFSIAKVTGVEFSRRLCRVAEENCRKFATQNVKNRDCKWEIIYDDACVFPIPRDANLAFFYNPFNGPVIDIIARKILEHAYSANVPVIIVYVNPIHDIIFKNLGYRKLHELSNEAAIYTCT